MDTIISNLTKIQSSTTTPTSKAVILYSFIRFTGQVYMQYSQYSYSIRLLLLLILHIWLVPVKSGFQ